MCVRVWCFLQFSVLFYDRKISVLLFDNEYLIFRFIQSYYKPCVLAERMLRFVRRVIDKCFQQKTTIPRACYKERCRHSRSRSRCHCFVSAAAATVAVAAAFSFV